ncbi:SH3 domain-containing protein [Telmatobacter bradus]|uniref:SH3 domain-containing protein n=1 Tax=Telmatobacter bradus TaxID=474953 RepID=UPI003B428E9B
MYKPISISSALHFRRSRALRLLALSCVLAALAGCNRFRHTSYDTVYVNARQTYLHDRVAAVSARVAPVINGQKLQVLERNRRFIKVKTEKNEIGWLEERSVIPGPTYDSFTKLADDHRNDPVTAQAILRDDLFMHLTPGRNTDHFYLLPGNTKVQLLARATAERTQPGQTTPHPAQAAQPQPSQQSAKPASAPQKPAQPAPSANQAAQPAAVELPPPPPMEDWWLVRDAQGHTGWLLSGRLDVDVPDEIGLYAEGQRIVGAWVLATVEDDESQAANHQVPEYLTLLSPPKSGLPFDFDQIRVFTWNIKKHRYETAFHQRDLQGYLPIKVTQRPASGGAASFSLTISADGNAKTDPATGIARPVTPRILNYQLIDTSVRRVGPDLYPLPGSKDKDKDKAAQDKKNAKPGAKKKK